MYGYFPPYVSVAEKKEKAEKELAKLKKKNPNIHPVTIQGNKISKTWWGIAWNKNLESYADYANRLGRGRSYVRNGCVLDLEVEAGNVTALVTGGGRTPYSITIQIDSLKKETWDNIVNVCGNRIDSIKELTEGKFPKELEEIFTMKGKGLFPDPKEISFSCSCPDYAYMCKHVAAALYGIGARFDEDPTLFFKLREIDMDLLLKKSIEDKMNSLLKNSDNKTTRVMENADIEDLFGL